MRTRPQLSAPLAFAAVAAVIGLALFASATPSPLYGVYEARWHFSTPTLTLVYAVYAIGVLAALLLVGGLSDDVGRRPVLLWSLALLLVAMGLFAVARSLAWLFAARALQGVSTGAVLGAAGAALLELHPRADNRQASLVNGSVSNAGIGAGALVSALAVQFLPHPRVLPFVLVIVLTAALIVALRRLPEPVARRSRPRLRPRRPRIPAQTRGPFLLAALGVLASWSIGGVYLALGPQLASALMHTHGQLAGGVAVFALAAPAGLSQFVGRRWADRTLTAGGALALALGMALAAVSVSASSAALFLAASAVTGFGFGLAFMGALHHLSEAIPEDRRGEVMSAFYVVAYLALSLPAIAAGFAAPTLGLGDTFQLFAAAVIVLALAVAAGGLRIEAPTACAVESA
jgi:MFS family permease